MGRGGEISPLWSFLEVGIYGLLCVCVNRTGAVHKARHLVEMFGWSRYFLMQEIYPGDKTTHFFRSVGFLARDSMLSALYAIANPSVCLSVTRVDQSKTVEVRIMQFSPYSSFIPLVFTV